MHRLQGPEIPSFPVSVGSAESEGAGRCPAITRPQARQPLAHALPCQETLSETRPWELSVCRAPPGLQARPAPRSPLPISVWWAEPTVPPESPHGRPPLGCFNLPRAAASADGLELDGAVCQTSGSHAKWEKIQFQ